jgi:UDP-N-acetylglucosamine--N-acetylmuramyl-(pentapeptide) pyrophosphoryl-undecaprenol N-acetylglucosamine transferase
VVSRAGALSVSELCLAGKPAILIPYPAAAEDHQTKNALSLLEQHAAILIRDDKTRKDLIPEVLHLLGDGTRQQELKLNIKKLGKPSAAHDIAAEVLKLVRS